MLLIPQLSLQVHSDYKEISSQHSFQMKCALLMFLLTVADEEIIFWLSSNTSFLALQRKSDC